MKQYINRTSEHPETENIAICKKCGKEFIRRNGTNMYCKNCRVLKCYYCGKEFNAKWTYQITRERVYCCREHANKVEIVLRNKGKKELANKLYREKHKERYSKTHKYDGYGLFWNNDLWIHSQNGDKPIYQYLWEKYIGKIPDGYIIHHKDGNHSNNCLYNLECITRAEHIRKHNINRWGYSDPVRKEKGDG